MSGQILDATLVAAPKQRNTNAEKADLIAKRLHSSPPLDMNQIERIMLYGVSSVKQDDD